MIQRCIVRPVRIPILAYLWLLTLALSLPAAASDFDRRALEAALYSTDRDIMDRMRDAQRKPVDVMEFLGVQPGMHALDVYAAGGYYTFVLSRAVGLTGRVYAQNSPRAASFEQDRSEMTQGDALDATIERGSLINVVRVDQGINNISLEPASLDFVLVSQILHDYYNRSPQRALALLTTLYRTMKPGATLGIIDHSGIPGQNNERLHRMVKSDAVEIVQAAGFVLEAESDLLANPADNPRRSIFDPMLNRNTDQFLLRFSKPL